MQVRPTRILFIRFSSIGDIILTAPAILSLRNALVGPLEIHYLTRDSMRPAVQGLGSLVDNIHTIQTSTTEVTDTLKALEFDYLIDLQSNVRSRWVKRSLNVLSFTVDKQNIAKWLLVHGWRKQPVRHIVERYIETFAQAFGSKVPEEWPLLFSGAVHPLPEHSKYVAIALSATHQGKRLTVEILNAIIQLESTNRSIILIGGQEDIALGNELERRHASVKSLAGRTSLFESAAIIRDAERLYTGDTGMMHIAAAVGTAITSFWGCTRPILGMDPWRPNPQSRIISPDKQLGSRPCSKLGNKACRHQPSCMAQNSL